MESKPEFRLPADGPDSASGAAERLDAVCGDGEQAEDFCNHGAGILAGVVGQKLSYPHHFFGRIPRIAKAERAVRNFVTQNHARALAPSRSQARAYGA